MISKNILIRGPPRSGKTTLIKDIITTFPNIFHGFYTNEVRKEKERIGFDVFNLYDSYTVQLARVGHIKPKIGKYTVFVKQFDHFIKKCYEFDKVESKKNIIIDEIGKMELLSENFVLWVKKIFHSNFIIATIPNQRIEMIDKILDSAEHVIYDLNLQNWEDVKEKIMKYLKAILS